MYVVEAIKLVVEMQLRVVQNNVIIRSYKKFVLEVAVRPSVYIVPSTN